VQQRLPQEIPTAIYEDEDAEEHFGSVHVCMLEANGSQVEASPNEANV